ncbi:HGGxSTG domain-containing protein [Thermomonas sp.]|uniref:HGGxSTG domain-containing protein n=1 Tax=Thermomonas sp. TaxID=1971895 RepID=UPI0035B2F023
MTSVRVQCGATRHRDGQPCQAKSEPGKRRCRFHGGRSTGPRTPEGKARSLANLRQFRCLPANPLNRGCHAH